MEAATVVGLVTALIETFADGHADYEAWKHRRFSSNHYRGKSFASTPCALSTTLAIAGPQIQGTYEKAVSIVGAEFSTGDFNCRSMLWSQLNVLSDRVANLHRAAAATTWAVVDLADATQVCEDVRRASLHALADQYQRIVAGRPVPKALGVVRPRLQATVSAQSDESLRPVAPKPIVHTLTPPKHQMRYQISQMHRPQPQQVIQRKPPPQRQYSHHSHQHPSPPTDNDQQMSANYSNDALHIHDEPPSPPLTPKTSGNRSDSSISSVSTRPANSVFAQFCAEAMSLQVDTKRAVPGDARCACGYEWHIGRRDAVPLKEGFRLTHRYLAKSHVGPQGFGCVLCTSTGTSGRFEGVEELREHVNASHTKWQLLHDQDCRASSKLADGFW